MNVRYFEKRPGAWHIDFRDEHGARKRPYAGTTRAEAERNAPAVIAMAVTAGEAMRGPAPAPVAPTRPRSSTGEAPAGMTLRAAYTLALTTREAWITSKSRHTLEQTYGQLGLDDDTPLATLTRDRVRKLREQWMVEPGKRAGSRLSSSTINHRLSMLSVLLEVADLPPHTVKHLSTKGTRRTRRVSDVEVARGRAWLAAEGHRKGAVALSYLIACALACGAREGELLGLRREDYTGSEATFRDTKNGETRTVPLRPDAIAAIEARRGVPHGPFADLTGDRVKDLWNEMRAGMGLAEDPEFVFHALRHEFASRLVDEGADAFTIMALMGHANITTTQVYVKASMTGMRRALGIPASQPLRIVNG